MAKLAIKGHATRGSEVIELLEMLGGQNPEGYIGDRESFYYFIRDNEIDLEFKQNLPNNAICFTLEEFLEKFPYKVGDKVQRKGATSCGSIFEVEKMRWEEGTVRYTLHLFGCNSKTSTLPSECLQPYKEETMEERQYKELRMPLDDNDKLATEVTIDGNKILPPNGYLIGKITQLDNGMFVEYVKKQSQYPKTYEECCEILMGKNTFHDFTLVLTNLSIGKNGEDIVALEPPHIDTINSLYKLLICRGAYWKIAGEQMGLGKPWEPDWLNIEQDKFVLYTHNNVICSNRFVLGHNVLAFPTAEMRDAFFENFKDLIEDCKEFL